MTSTSTPSNTGTLNVHAIGTLPVFITGSTKGFIHPIGHAASLLDLRSRQQRMISVKHIEETKLEPALQVTHGNGSNDQAITCHPD